MQSYMHMHCQARQLDSYSSARHCSTARQLLDRPRQNSTPRRMESGSTGSTGTRQELDSNSTGSTGKASTAPRQRLDSASTEPRHSSTARQPGLNLLPHAWVSAHMHIAHETMVRRWSGLTCCRPGPGGTWAGAAVVAIGVGSPVARLGAHGRSRGGKRGPQSAQSADSEHGSEPGAPSLERESVEV